MLWAIMQMKQLTSSHRFCGFQNLLILSAFCWCCFRIFDILFSFFFLLYTILNTSPSDSTSPTPEWLISDISSFVMVIILSSLVYYFAFLIHEDNWGRMKKIVIVVLVILNIFHIVTLSAIDITLMFKNDEYLTVLTMAFATVSYFCVLVGLCYVSIRVFSVSPHKLEQSHPSPKSMGIAGIIISICVSTRFIYDFGSAVAGKSLLALLCDDTTGKNIASICYNNPESVVIFADIIEFLLMTFWEIIPLSTLLVLFWNVPKSKTYNPFENLFKATDAEENSSTDVAESTPFIEINE
ncbi:hypothetical protein EIN_181440 [Entamoeba invadens IP1]|uniref:hypothetical protein n=1 Tax=Entamoeba invadens IP1 TaxID=370355 RepID=UPI0002C3E3C0|nr:hypothetical protein EIN_181440 [Entamoeba invadens IP1]ELP93977.1 hypothetical protein EIN_181440 [Entamoeba invadens IP1]|eukprot:XP_004260748.1 hypothetical protein EIN_181440 [Entamoeba invadens IP1]